MAMRRRRTKTDEARQEAPAPASRAPRKPGVYMVAPSAEPLTGAVAGQAYHVEPDADGVFEVPFGATGHFRKRGCKPLTE